MFKLHLLLLSSVSQAYGDIQQHLISKDPNSANTARIRLLFMFPFLNSMGHLTLLFQAQTDVRHNALSHSSLYLVTW